MSFRNFPAGVLALAGSGGGGSNVNFTGDPYFVIDASAGPPAEAEIQLTAAGGVNGLRLNLPDQLIGSWFTLPELMSNYDFRLDTTSGSLSSPGSQSADTWINGFPNMFWGVRENGVGISSFTGTLRVRPAGGGADIDTASVSLQAETV